MTVLNQQYLAAAFFAFFNYTSAQIFIESRCFQRDQYHFFAASESSFFSAARDACDSIGAKVVLVQNVEEMNFVHDFWTSLRPSQSIYLGMVGSNTQQESFNPARFLPDDPEHYNLSFFETPRIFPWESFEPDDSSGRQPCVEWSPENLWRDRGCNLKNAVMCRNSCPPTSFPTLSPTTSAPTKFPTSSPSLKPTSHPTVGPTKSPSFSPTSAPTLSPTRAPTDRTTLAPTKSPIVDEVVFAPSAAVVSIVGISSLMTSLGFFLYARRKTGSQFTFKDQGMVPPPDVDFEYTVGLDPEGEYLRDSRAMF